jgi:hypothetical protein
VHLTGWFVEASSIQGIQELLLLLLLLLLRIRFHGSLMFPQDV